MGKRRGAISRPEPQNYLFSEPVINVVVYSVAALMLATMGTTIYYLPHYLVTQECLNVLPMIQFTSESVYNDLRVTDGNCTKLTPGAKLGIMFGKETGYKPVSAALGAAFRCSTDHLFGDVVVDPFSALLGFIEECPALEKFAPKGVLGLNAKAKHILMLEIDLYLIAKQLSED